MTGTAWPFIETNTTGAPAVTARQLRQMHSSFVSIGSAARPLGAKSGVRPGTPASVVSITGSGPYTWSAGGFGGVIDGEANAAAGPYTYSFETPDTGTIAAAGAAARADRLDVQISDSDEGDGSGAKSVQVVYTQGAATGGAVPAAPARSHPLATINVPATGGGAPTVTFAPGWASSSGRWVFNTVAERDLYVTTIGSANVPPRWVSVVISDTTTANNGEYWWSGTGWVHRGATVSGTVTYATGVAVQSGYTTQLDKSEDGLVTLNFGVFNANQTVAETLLFTLPTGFLPSNPLVLCTGSYNALSVVVFFEISSSGQVVAYPTSTLGTGANIYGSISFRAA